MSLERYDVIKKIGEGATASIFLLWDRSLERYVVAKCGTEKDILLAEARYLAQSVSKDFPVLYEYKENEEMAFLFMEYILGENLAERLSRIGTYTETEALQILVAVAKLLGTIHHAKNPCVYGDLKPENVMIQQDGRIRLIDLGAVLEVDDKGMDVRSGRKRGATPGYAAPEIWNRKPDIRNDIYSLGKLMLFFARHTQGLSDNGNYMRIAEKCTEEEIQCRYADTNEFLKDMEILLRQG